MKLRKKIGRKINFGKPVERDYSRKKVTSNGEIMNNLRSQKCMKDYKSYHESTSSENFDQERGTLCCLKYSVCFIPATSF